MTAVDKNIQIQDMSGNNLYPKTKGAVVLNNSGQNLGGVEAGAQVNILEKVKVNGTELTISQKAVDITIPSQSEYTIAKATTADSGYVATYVFKKDGTQVGDKINIPKDLVVQSGEVKTCTTANNPVSGYAKGDKYIDLVLANSDNSHIYILVSDLVDVYTAGNGITISGNAVSIDTTVVATQTDLAGKANASHTHSASDITSGLATVATTGAYADLSGTPTLATVATSGSYADLSNKPSIPTVDQTYSASSVNAQSGVAVASAISGKANSATTLSGYGITDALTYVELA